MRWDSLFS